MKGNQATATAALTRRHPAGCVEEPTSGVLEETTAAIAKRAVLVAVEKLACDVAGCKRVATRNINKVVTRHRDTRCDTRCDSHGAVNGRMSRSLATPTASPADR